MRRANVEKLDESSLPKKKVKPVNDPYSWLWSPFSIGLVGALVGSMLTYMVSSYSTEASLGLESRLHRETLQFQNKLAALRGIYDAGGSIGRDLRITSDPKEYEFSSVSLKGLSNKKELRRAIAFAAMLPGLRRLDLEDTPADDSVMEDIEANFINLDYLNIGGTRVTTLSSIDNLNLEELNINQTPLLDEQFGVIGRMQDLTKLTFGPPTLQADGKTIYKLKLATVQAAIRAAPSLWDVELDSNKLKLDATTLKLLSERKPVGID